MKILIILAGGYANAHGERGACGEIVDFREELALKLIRNGFAVPAPAQKPTIETAQAGTPQNAARRVGKTSPRKAV